MTARDRVADALESRFRETAGPHVAMPARSIWLAYADAAIAALADPEILTSEDET